MLRDRGTKKWTAMMLPEHVQQLKKALVEENKTTQPILDEQKIEMLEELVLEAMEETMKRIHQEEVNQEIKDKKTLRRLKREYPGKIIRKAGDGWLILEPN